MGRMGEGEVEGERNDVHFSEKKNLWVGKKEKKKNTWVTCSRKGDRLTE